MILIVYAILFVSLFVAVFFLYTFFENIGKIATKASSKTPSVSIIIPAYNEGRTIASTLSALLELDYPKDKLEIIVVNDGSTDNTLEIVKKFEKLFPNFKVFTKKNQGCKAYPVNYGLARASHELIWVLDAECRPFKDCLRKLIPYLENKETMCVAPAVGVWQPKRFWEKLQVIEFALAAFRRKILHFINSQIYAAAAPLVKAEFFRKYGGFDETTLSEDLELGMRVIAKGYRMAHAIDAIVETGVPETFVKLAKQRIRWSYGLLENIKKYGLLFNPKHGDLGMFYLPVTLSFMFMLIFLFIRVVVESVWQTLLGSSRLAGIGYDFGYSVQYYTKNFVFTYDLMLYLMIVLIVVGLATYLIAKKLVGVTRPWKKQYIFYMFVYIWVLGIFHLIALIRFILKKKPVWSIER